MLYNCNSSHANTQGHKWDIEQNLFRCQPSDDQMDKLALFQRNVGTQNSTHTKTRRFVVGPLLLL